MSDNDTGFNCAIGQPSAAVLTKSQLAVVALIAEGLTNKHVARRLDVTEATIRAHVMNASKRLRVNNRKQLARWYSSVKASSLRYPEAD